MASTLLLNITPLSSASPTKHLNLLSPSLITSHHRAHKRGFTVLALASSSTPLINVDYLKREFYGHGVTFTGIGDSCVAKMQMSNGSTASVMFPNGLITSYKAHMWHGGNLEVLHTTVNKGEDGGALIQGGVSLALKCGSPDDVPWSPSTWALHDVRGGPDESIKVELISGDSESPIEVKYTVTLQPDQLSSEILISNLKASPICLMGFFMSHVTVSTPDATYAVGLEGSNYFNKLPLESEFSIIPPAFAQTKSWGQRELQGLLSKWDRKDHKNTTESKGEVGEEEEMEEEERDNYKQLTEKTSRIYTSTPRIFTIIDRGKRNSLVVGREGFDEQYIFSPGSNHEWYDKYAYVCTGPSAMLKPITLNPKCVWTGGQYLHNPNI
ncbi:hypothetical protein Syun_017248 [Stephania yunnanensis]|uniref:Protein NDH-DEPENDENT CYCLIC ELECTRON FLOW 5 n=1 Tax=Stephania yunnanensis TaxID=152371 RepID=A0AAP0J6K9_9MAGN